MLKKSILCASLVAAFASVGGTAQAEDRDHDRDHNWNNARNEHRDNNRRDWNNGHDNGNHYGETRRMGGPERHHWARGERLPSQYYGGGRYVDWRAHRLHAPPRGYQWVDVDGDYVLVALTTGLIADLIINSR